MNKKHRRLGNRQRNRAVHTDLSSHIELFERTEINACTDPAGQGYLELDPSAAITAEETKETFPNSGGDKTVKTL